MDFPEFGNDEVIQIDDQNVNHTNYQAFEVDGGDGGDVNHKTGYEGAEVNHNTGYEAGGFGSDWNASAVDKNQEPKYDPFTAYTQAVDEEEENRIRQRKAEEDERRSRLMQRMNDEVRVKQDTRDKARTYLEDWNT
jgi:hypothetical protein